MTSNSILLVEDDTEIKEMLWFYLERAQFTIIEAESAEMAMSLLHNHELHLDDVPRRIGPTKFRLLEMLIRHPDRTFSRSQLLDRVWGRSA